MEKPWRDKDVFEKWYKVEDYTQSELAKKWGCSRSNISKWARKHGIEVDRRANHQTSRKKDEEVLRRLYVEEGLTTEEVANELGVTGWTISRWLDECGIDTRNHGTRRYSELWDEEYIRQKYWDEGMTMGEIADEIGCERASVGRAMDRLGIDKRSMSEELSGERAPRWKGGHTNYCGPNWQRKRRKALDRDSYSCQRCGMTDEEHRKKYGRSIEVHHISRRESFRDDSGNINWEKANQLSNLISLCKQCHAKLEGLPIDNGQ